MNLYLLRHSNAEEKPPSGEAGDQFRRLTAEGRAKARLIGKAIQRLELGIDLVLTSPAARARETAGQVVSRLEPQPPVEQARELWIGGDFRDITARLRQGGKRATEILLVGHEPDLGQLMSRLLTGGSDLRVSFRKGGLCKLAIARLVTGRCATLEWLLTPKQLRMMGGH